MWPRFFKSLFAGPLWLRFYKSLFTGPVWPRFSKLIVWIFLARNYWTLKSQEICILKTVQHFVIKNEFSPKFADFGKSQITQILRFVFNVFNFFVSHSSCPLDNFLNQTSLQIVRQIDPPREDLIYSFLVINSIQTPMWWMLKYRDGYLCISLR